MNSTDHEIRVIHTHLTGAEEWYCSTCGRHFFVQWAPEYQCVVLDPGDLSAVHNMARGALVVFNREDEERLSIWRNFIDRIDLESQLDGEDASNSI